MLFKGASFESEDEIKSKDLHSPAKISGNETRETTDESAGRRIMPVVYSRSKKFQFDSFPSHPTGESLLEHINKHGF